MKTSYQQHQQHEQHYNNDNKEAKMQTKLKHGLLCIFVLVKIEWRRKIYKEEKRRRRRRWINKTKRNINKWHIKTLKIPTKVFLIAIIICVSSVLFLFSPFLLCSLFVSVWNIFWAALNIEQWKRLCAVSNHWTKYANWHTQTTGKLDKAGSSLFKDFRGSSFSCTHFFVDFICLCFLNRFFSSCIKKGLYDIWTWFVLN